MSDNGNNGPRRRGARIWPLVSLGAAAAWLYVHRTDDDTRRMFFGLWRTRDVLVASALVWFTAATAAACVSRKALFGFVFVTILAGAGLVLLEGAGMTGVVSYGRLFGHEREALGSRPIPNADLSGETYEDLAYGWGYPTAPVPFRYRTDRHGHRNAEDRAAADAYLVGDSILVAGLLPFEQTVAARLERALARPVMNVALIGLSPQAERARFVAAKLPVEGRLVLQFIFEGNDLADSATHRAEAGSGPTGPSFVERTFTYNAVLALQRLTDPRRLASERRIGRIDGHDYLFHWGREAFEGVDGEAGAVEASIRSFRDDVVAAGGRYAVVFVPAKIRVLGPLCSWPPESTLTDYRAHLNPFRERLIAWCASAGVDVIDTSDALIAAARSGRIPWFAGDTHPNTIGHEVLATVLGAARPVTAWAAAGR